jgi:pimeloyl-ACP methyl ester carboxylesterase
MNTFEKNATVILVHGAWADGSSWSRVIEPLREAGLAAVCAPMPLTSLSEDIAMLTKVVERAQGPVLLAGHAYGGAPMAGVTHERVKGLVYIAALAPDAGETVADVFFREKPHPQAPALAPDAQGLIWMPESGFANAFAQNAPQETHVILNAIQRPISVKCIQEKVPVPAWKTRSSWYLVAEQDRMIPAATQRFMADRMKARVFAHPVDHTPSITAPEVVVDILIEAANSVLKKM